MPSALPSEPHGPRPISGVFLVSWQPTPLPWHPWAAAFRSAPDLRHPDLSVLPLPPSCPLPSTSRYTKNRYPSGVGPGHAASWGQPSGLHSPGPARSPTGYGRKPRAFGTHCDKAVSAGRPGVSQSFVTMCFTVSACWPGGPGQRQEVSGGAGSEQLGPATWRLHALRVASVWPGPGWASSGSGSSLLGGQLTVQLASPWLPFPSLCDPNVLPFAEASASAGSASESALEPLLGVHRTPGTQGHQFHGRGRLTGEACRAPAQEGRPPRQTDGSRVQRGRRPREVQPPHGSQPRGEGRKPGTEHDTRSSMGPDEQSGRDVPDGETAPGKQGRKHGGEDDPPLKKEQAGKDGGAASSQETAGQGPSTRTGRGGRRLRARRCKPASPGVDKGPASRKWLS